MQDCAVLLPAQEAGQKQDVEGYDLVSGLILEPSMFEDPDAVGNRNY